MDLNEARARYDVNPYRAYHGSDAALTTYVMNSLLKCGDDGKLAVLLFKAQKASARAKKYRGGRDGKSFRLLAYQRKSETMTNLATFLDGTGGEAWGWGRDRKTEGFPWVLYVDLPTGQCGFHSRTRGPGRDYDGQWTRDSNERVILDYCDLVLSS